MAIQIAILAPAETETRALRQLLRAEPDVDVLDDIRPTTRTGPLGGGLPVPDMVICFAPADVGHAPDPLQAIQSMQAPPLVVVIAADERHALHAFRLRALDYLVQPVKRADVRAMMQRVRLTLHERHHASLGRQLAATYDRLTRNGARAVACDGAPHTTPPADVAPRPAIAVTGSYLERIAVAQDERIILVKVDDIDYLESSGNYVLLHIGPNVFQVRETLGHIEAQLSPFVFARIHRRSIVNIERVRELRPWFTGDFQVILRDGTELRLSRTYRAQFDTALYRPSIR